MTVEAAEVLDKAADLIDPAKGGRWIRRTFTDDTGGRCILGALSTAAGVSTNAWVVWPPSASLFHAGYLRLKYLLEEDPAEWNDQDCLDGAEAANVLRKAAEIERHS